MTPPLARLLPDGRRLHLGHGPIDLVVEAVGAASPSPLGRGDADPAVRRAYRAAAACFATLLDELCAELPLLRSHARPDRPPEGAVARRMHAAVLPFAAEGFISPMAAVAGAVAEEVLRAMTGAADLRRASVNNGGDIALHLAAGEEVRIGLVDRPDAPSLFGTTAVRAGDGIRGVATSGWRGRSFSLGIADAATILARTAAEADAAATVVANAVDLPGHPAVVRMPARDVQHDSDLGERLVVQGVGRLAPSEVEKALARGLAVADDLCRGGLIAGAALHLQGTTAVTDPRSDVRRGPSFPCRRRRLWRPRGSAEASPTHVESYPSSVTAPPCHLLPQGDKDRCAGWDIAA